jgi:hypothetical protein
MPQLPHTHEQWLPILVGVAAIIVLIVIPLVVLISYLLIRLRFSYFDCVLRMQDRIGPAWARYHRQAMRYLGMTICVGLAFWVAIALAGYGIYDHFKLLIQSLGSENKPGWVAFLPLIGVVILMFSLLGIAASLINTALGSFVLPHMALEDATIADALSDVWSDFVAEPWQYVFFVLLRFLTTLAASIIAAIGLIIPLVVVVAIGAVIVIILKTVSTSLAVLLGVPAGLLVLVLFFLAGIGVGGSIGTFRRNYAILFYGGRYPVMGNMLQQPQAPLPVAPIQPWNPAAPPGPAPGSWASGG